MLNRYDALLGPKCCRWRVPVIINRQTAKKLRKISGI